MTLSTVFQSVFGTSKHSATGETVTAREQQALNRYAAYQRTFPMAEIALPANALTNSRIAGWARAGDVLVDVRTRDELNTAIAAGIHPALMSVHAETMGAGALVSSVALGVGRFVIASTDEFAMLSAIVGSRRQGVDVRISEGSRKGQDEIDRVVGAVHQSRNLQLTGLRCEVGSRGGAFISYPAAIGHTVAHMTSIRRRCGLQLDRIWLAGGHDLPTYKSTRALNERAAEIDISLDDACTTMGFPRPTVILAAEPAIVSRWAA